MTDNQEGVEGVASTPSSPATRERPKPCRNVKRDKNQTAKPEDAINLEIIAGTRGRTPATSTTARATVETATSTTVATTTTAPAKIRDRQHSQGGVGSDNYVEPLTGNIGHACTEKRMIRG